MSQKRREIKKDYTAVGQNQTETKEVKETKTEALHIQVSFDQWWLQTQQKYNFKPALKDALKKHFETKGFINDSRNFEKGLRDFGFNT